jgi:hypothetical protein
MKRLSKDSVFTITEYINDNKGGSFYFTSVRKVNAFINKLVAAGANEGSWHDNSHQEWTRENKATGDIYCYVILQDTFTNFTNFVGM